MVGYLDVHSGAIQALATVILVAITFYYSFLTKQAVKEATNTRKDARLPIIRVGINGPNSAISSGNIIEKYVSFQLKNVGYGIARSITISISDKHPVVIRSLDTDKEWVGSKIILKDEEIDKIDSLPSDQKIITVSYKDIFSREIKTIAHFENTHQEEWPTFTVTDWELILPA